MQWDDYVITVTLGCPEEIVLLSNSVIDQLPGKHDSAHLLHEQQTVQESPLLSNKIKSLKTYRAITLAHKHLPLTYNFKIIISREHLKMSRLPVWHPHMSTQLLINFDIESNKRLKTLTRKSCKFQNFEFHFKSRSTIQN